MKTRISAALAAMTLTASTACAAVIDFSNALGPSGGYNSEAYYQSVRGDQTTTQQAYADQEDQLRQLGYLSELSGDIALGQIFYHIAYGVNPPLSALDLDSGGSDVGPSSITPSGLVPGSSGAGSMLTTFGAYSSADLAAAFVYNGGVGVSLTAVPEASTWVMMLLGFVGLGLASYKRRGELNNAIQIAARTRNNRPCNKD